MGLARETFVCFVAFDFELFCFVGGELDLIKTFKIVHPFAVCWIVETLKEGDWSIGLSILSSDMCQ